MKIDSALKYIWLAVGVLVLGCILTGIFFALDLDNTYRRPREQQGVTIDNSTKERLEKVNLELSYSSPINLGNSDHYMLNVYISYKKDESKLEGGFDSYSRKDMDVNEPSNIIFLDKNLTPVRTLFDKKALVTSVYYPQETILGEEEYQTHTDMKYILYEIVFNDTDEDGQLDAGDNSDLYISELDGSNLTAITNGMNVEEIEFLDKYETILIRYYKKEDADLENLLFATYSITKKELTELKQLSDALQGVKEILTK